MMNTERLLKHAVQEKLAITLCLNKVQNELANKGLIKQFCLSVLTFICLHALVKLSLLRCFPLGKDDLVFAVFFSHLFAM